ATPSRETAITIVRPREVRHLPTIRVHNKISRRGSVRPRRSAAPLHGNRFGDMAGFRRARPERAAHLKSGFGAPAAFATRCSASRPKKLLATPGCRMLIVRQPRHFPTRHAPRSKTEQEAQRGGGVPIPPRLRSDNEEICVVEAGH